MIPALLIAIALTFTYMMWRRYQRFNGRQLIICKQTLQTILVHARHADEDRKNLEILLNAAIDTYNEGLKGPWFYRNRWKIPAHEYQRKDDEIERHSERGHSDSQGENSQGEEQNSTTRKRVDSKG